MSTKLSSCQLECLACCVIVMPIKMSVKVWQKYRVYILRKLSCERGRLYRNLKFRKCAVRAENNEKREDEKDVRRYNTYRARIYSGLTVISGVMLPNFCNTDSVCTAVQLVLILVWLHTFARYGAVMYNSAEIGDQSGRTRRSSRR